MKNHIKWLGVIALLAVIGLSFAACDNGTTDAEKSITITGIPAEYINSFYILTVSGADSKAVAYGDGMLYVSTVTCDLYNPKSNADGGWTKSDVRWTGKGTVDMSLWIFSGNTINVHAEANITNAVTTIPFSKFQ